MKRTLLGFLIISLFYACSKDSEPTAEEDSTPPQIAIQLAGYTEINPAVPLVVSNSLVIAIDAQDSGGISVIEAFLDNTKVGEDRTPPFNITVDVSSFESKAASSGKYKDYTLLVTATDASGNQSSIEQIINIDNELPVIEAVSMDADTILAGDSNAVTFDAWDNEALVEVRVLVNGDLLKSFTSPPYLFNLATTTLESGPNSLLIEAEDAASNTTQYTVSFIADNTGPELSFDNLVNGQTVDQQLSISGTASDPYSGLASATLVLGDSTLATYSPSEPIVFEFDTEAIPVGAQNLTLRAIDSLENQSEISIDISIKRRLLTINLPDNYLNSGIPYQYYVFASDMGGSLLGSKQVYTFDTEVVLHANGEIGMEEPFMVTFASIGVNTGVANYLNTYLGLDRSKQLELRPDDPGTYYLDGSVPVSTNGVEPENIFQCRGADYSLSSDESGGLLFDAKQPGGLGGQSSTVYAAIFNQANGYYAFQTLNKPIPAGYVFDFADFSTQQVSQGSFSTDPATYITDNSSNLQLYGFTDQEAYESNVFHEIHSYGYGRFLLSEFNYPIVSYFGQYTHRINIGSYHTEGPGIPANSYSIPAWTIDPVFDGQNISLNTTGNGHAVGKLFFSNDGAGPDPYEWSITFDSQTESIIVLPDLPGELAGKPIFSLAESGSLSLLQSELRAYPVITDYAAYLNNLVRLNGPRERPLEAFSSIVKNINGEGAYFDQETTFFRN